MARAEGFQPRDEVFQRMLVEWCEGLTEVSISIRQYSLDCRGVRLKGFVFPLLSPTVFSSQNLENSEVTNDNTVPKAAVSVPEAEELIAPGTPIQFDIVLPATEFLDQNRGSRYVLREASGRKEHKLGPSRGCCHSALELSAKWPPTGLR